MTIVHSFDELIQHVDRKRNEVSYNVIAELVQRADEYSPVGDINLWKRPKSAPEGYIGGQFRGNWILGVNEIPEGYELGKIDPTGVSTVAENLSRIPSPTRYAYKNQYHLVNNLPYARALEDGHSSQAPAGIVGRLQLEFKSIVEQVVADIKAGGGRVR